MLDETNKKCKTCIFAIPPDSQGKCNLPSTLIKGCLEYSSDGKCTKCYEGNEEYTPNSKGGCDFVGCDEQTEYKYYIVVLVKQAITGLRMIMIIIYVLDLMEA